MPVLDDSMRVIYFLLLHVSKQYKSPRADLGGGQNPVVDLCLDLEQI